MSTHPRDTSKQENLTSSKFWQLPVYTGSDGYTHRQRYIIVNIFFFYQICKFLHAFTCEEKRNICLLQRTLKNFALCKIFQSALNLGPSQRTLKKIFFFQSALISFILTHFEKYRKSNFAWFALFLLFKISKTIVNLKMNRYFQIFYRRFYLFFVHLSRFWNDMASVYIMQIKTIFA